MFRPQKTFLALLLFISLNSNAQINFSEHSNTNGLDFSYAETLKMGGGAASFDFDNDGDYDIYVVGGQNSDGLFQNDGNGNFENVSLSTNIAPLTNSVMTTSVVTGDIDNDGYREIFVGTIGSKGTNFEDIKPNLLLRYNPTTGQYENIIGSTLIADTSFCMGGHFFDSNQDGLLDLYVINYVEHPEVIQEGSDVVGFNHDCYENKLYINSGDGTFTDLTSQYGLEQIGCSLAATSSDLDWDGDPDIIVANDFGKWLTPNQLFQNEGPEKQYTDISQTSNTNAKMYGMGIGIGDYDEDLDLDFYVTNIGENYFFENQGNMVFENKAHDLDIQNSTTTNGLNTTGWGAIMEDFNNDSYLDLFVTNGYVYSVVDIDDEEQPDELYLGTPNRDFEHATGSSGIDFKGTSRGSMFGDWNSDGQLDLITITNEISPDVQHSSINYYQNQTDAGNWICFNLRGTISNRDAFGAKVILHTGERAFLRELRGGDSHASQNSSIIHFGLDNMDHVDSVTVFWPSGVTQTFEEPTINSYHDLIESTVSSTVNSSHQEIKVYPNPARHTLNIENTGNTSNLQNIKILNSLGEIVLEDQLSSKTKTIDISRLQSGIYTLISTSISTIHSETIVILTP